MADFESSEWEFLQEGINLIDKYQIRTNFNCNELIYCYLSRNENYEIALDVKCFSAENVGWNKIFMFEFENDEEIISMYYCILQSKNYGSDENGQYYNIKFRIKNVERTYKNNLYDVNLIKEFYLNCISDKFTFYRRTKYFEDSKYFKVRDVEKDKLEEIKDKIPKRNDGDWLLLELKDFSFIIQQVDEIGPHWSNNMYIEYQKELTIPNSEIRQKNREILSFLLGKYLIKVGETHFDGEGNIIKEVAMLPQISPEVNLKNICNKREVPAIYCTDIMLLKWFEKSLSTLVDAYLSENEFILSNILEYLMGSTLIPIEYEIVGIGGCLDELCDNWSKSSNSNYDEFIITKKNFDDVMGDLLPKIEKKFDNYPYVFNKIRHSYNLIGYGKVRLFLNKLNINQGKAEKKARRYRNIAAHAHVMSVEEKLKMIYYTDVYRTFVNRIILKILGYNQYFDLTSYKNISIDNHLPEKDFKENIDEIKEFYKDYLKPE